MEMGDGKLVFFLFGPFSPVEIAQGPYVIFWGVTCISKIPIIPSHPGIPHPTPCFIFLQDICHHLTHSYKIICPFFFSFFLPLECKLHKDKELYLI